MRSLIGFLVVVGVQSVAIGGKNMFSMHLLEDNFGPPLKTGSYEFGVVIVNASQSVSQSFSESVSHCSSELVS